MILINSTRFLILAFVSATVIFALSCTNRKRDEVIPKQVIDSTCFKKTSFATDVQPIFLSKCYPCHDPQGQGQLPALNSYANAIVDTGRIAFRIQLPESDPLHMPTKGNEQLTPCELLVISRWVANGAPNN